MDIIKIQYEQISKRLQQEVGLTEQQIEEKVNAKVEQLSGLISKEGAAHIIANEYGVKLFEQQSGKLQISNILSGMRNVEVLGMVRAVYEVREFNTEKRSGKVGSFLIADETGPVRIVLWGNQTDLMRDLKEGFIVKIKGGYVKENSGRKEIHLNERADLIINPPGETVNVSLSSSGSYASQSIRKNISDLNENDANVEIAGTIVQAFEPKFFEVCPQCKKRARQREDSFHCEAHGQVIPDYSYVLNVFVDDGTDNIRVVCFSQTADQILKKTKDEVLLLKDSPQLFSSVQTELLGNVIKASGRVTKNAMFDRLEFVARNATYPDPETELQKLKAEVVK
ncbi:MAG: OB-fold nucleic acid binding domain-containing protein [Nanoarchaeota archaeon]|nr:OB-fold nucleic acid binding domain-containing protein [Nanoarchaeota archaeon]